MTFSNFGPPPRFYLEATYFFKISPLGLHLFPTRPHRIRDRAMARTS
jgi:hypothetical protein